MRIVSDNSEVLKELESRFESSKIQVKIIKVPADKTKKSEELDLVKLIIENPDESIQIIETIIEEVRSLYNQEHIYIETKNGDKIPYAIYKNMSLEEKREKDIFKA